VAEKCVICHVEITEDQEEFALDPEAHPGIQGPVHQECYYAEVEKHPDTPWEDPISGEVDYEAMEEDLGVDTGRGWEEEDRY